MFDLLEIWNSGNLEFGFPQAFWLAPLPLLILLLPPLKFRTEALYAPYFRDVLAIKKVKPSKGVRISRRNLMQIILMIIVWGLLITAFASPQLVGEPEKKVKTARNFLIAADISLSMDTRDWISASGKRTTRWDAVKEVMDEFVEKREGDRIGLVFFATQAYLQAPFTTDLETIRGLLDDSEVGMAGAKTAIGNAIGKGVELFQADSIEKRVLLLLTDGQDSGSELKPVQAARLAAADSITIYTLGIGSTSAGVYELDERTLTEIADAANGKYFRAQDREQLLQVYDELEKLEPIEFEDESYIPKRLLFYYPLLVALGITLVYFLIASLWQFGKWALMSLSH